MRQRHRFGALQRDPSAQQLSVNGGRPASSIGRSSRLRNGYGAGRLNDPQIPQLPPTMNQKGFSQSNKQGVPLLEKRQKAAKIDSPRDHRQSSDEKISGKQTESVDNDTEHVSPSKGSSFQRQVFSIRAARRNNLLQSPSKNSNKFEKLPQQQKKVDSFDQSSSDQSIRDGEQFDNNREMSNLSDAKNTIQTTKKSPKVDKLQPLPQMSKNLTRTHSQTAVKQPKGPLDRIIPQSDQFNDSHKDSDKITDSKRHHRSRFGHFQAQNNLNVGKKLYKEFHSQKPKEMKGLSGQETSQRAQSRRLRFVGNVSRSRVASRSALRGVDPLQNGDENEDDYECGSEGGINYAVQSATKKKRCEVSPPRSRLVKLISYAESGGGNTCQFDQENAGRDSQIQQSNNKGTTIAHSIRQQARGGFDHLVRPTLLLDNIRQVFEKKEPLDSYQHTNSNSNSNQMMQGSKFKPRRPQQNSKREQSPTNISQGGKSEVSSSISLQRKVALSDLLRKRAPSPAKLQSHLLLNNSNQKKDLEISTANQQLQARPFLKVNNDPTKSEEIDNESALSGKKVSQIFSKLNDIGKSVGNMIITAATDIGEQARQRAEEANQQRRAANNQSRQQRLAARNNALQKPTASAQQDQDQNSLKKAKTDFQIDLDYSSLTKDPLKEQNKRSASKNKKIQRRKNRSKSQRGAGKHNNNSSCEQSFATSQKSNNDQDLFFNANFQVGKILRDSSTHRASLANSEANHTSKVLNNQNREIKAPLGIQDQKQIQMSKVVNKQKVQIDQLIETIYERNLDKSVTFLGQLESIRNNFEIIEIQYIASYFEQLRINIHIEPDNVDLNSLLPQIQSICTTFGQIQNNKQLQINEALQPNDSHVQQENRLSNENQLSNRCMGQESLQQNSLVTPGINLREQENSNNILMSNDMVQGSQRNDGLQDKNSSQFDKQVDQNSVVVMDALSSNDRNTAGIQKSEKSQQLESVEVQTTKSIQSTSKLAQKQELLLKLQEKKRQLQEIQNALERQDQQKEQEEIVRVADDRPSSNQSQSNYDNQDLQVKPLTTVQESVLFSQRDDQQQSRLIHEQEVLASDFKEQFLTLCQQAEGKYTDYEAKISRAEKKNFGPDFRPKMIDQLQLFKHFVTTGKEAQQMFGYIRHEYLQSLIKRQNLIQDFKKGKISMQEISNLAHQSRLSLEQKLEQKTTNTVEEQIVSQEEETEENGVLKTEREILSHLETNEQNNMVQQQQQFVDTLGNVENMSNQNALIEVISGGGGDFVNTVSVKNLQMKDLSPKDPPIGHFYGFDEVQSPHDRRKSELQDDILQSRGQMGQGGKPDFADLVVSPLTAGRKVSEKSSDSNDSEEQKDQILTEDAQKYSDMEKTHEQLILLKKATILSGELPENVNIKISSIDKSLIKSVMEAGQEQDQRQLSDDSEEASPEFSSQHRNKPVQIEKEEAYDSSKVKSIEETENFEDQTKFDEEKNQQIQEDKNWASMLQSLATPNPSGPDDDKEKDLSEEIAIKQYSNQLHEEEYKRVQKDQEPPQQSHHSQSQITNSETRHVRSNSKRTANNRDRDESRTSKSSAMGQKSIFGKKRGESVLGERKSRQTGAALLMDQLQKQKNTPIKNHGSKTDQLLQRKEEEFAEQSKDDRSREKHKNSKRTKDRSGREKSGEVQNSMPKFDWSQAGIK